MLTVSIVTYNTPLGELGQCLDSLGVGVVERVFVVDNSRSDDIMRFCHQRANVEYVQSDNRGYGAGHNRACVQSDSVPERIGDARTGESGVGACAWHAQWIGMDRRNEIWV